MFWSVIQGVCRAAPGVAWALTGGGRSVINRDTTPGLMQSSVLGKPAFGDGVFCLSLGGHDLCLLQPYHVRNTP